ncbi:hypothetical protein [Vibrio algarum]|uniref:Uncharacterized protein n=1 Tax=Vibrio algarum TaxID=3020714 RepID=A0ABT4YWN5_9VIBR|nr:hypothetical protein [Vibrio sp. KJ40-1]MDB1125993.1 hypothetical protein [Vibrio sp. KJ40-1]
MAELGLSLSDILWVAVVIIVGLVSCAAIFISGLPSRRTTHANFSCFSVDNRNYLNKDAKFRSDFIA